MGWGGNCDRKQRPLCFLLSHYMHGVLLSFQCPLSGLCVRQISFHFWRAPYTYCKPTLHQFFLIYSSLIRLQFPGISDTTDSASDSVRHGCHASQSIHRCTVGFFRIFHGTGIFADLTAHKRQPRSVRRNRYLRLSLLPERCTSREVFWRNGEESNYDQPDPISREERAACFWRRCVYGNTVVPSLPWKRYEEIYERTSIRRHGM